VAQVIVAPKLISDSYRSMQTELHDKGNYGTASIQYAPLVTEMLNTLKITHLLDYGCSKLINLYKHIKPAAALKYQAYDPAVEEYSDPPFPAQMVACIDVLEHIEPDLLDNVLDDLARVTEVVLFCTVHTGPAYKTLSDGRNAHLTQQPMEWWLPKLWARFELQTVQVTGANQFYCICYAKQRLEAVNGDKL
jgi:hypothetical protein